MCGIFCLLYSGEEPIEVANCESRLSRLSRRGPNSYVRLSARKLTTNVQAKAIHGCVLRLRGLHIVQQPLLSDDESSFFLWNGEVFDGIEVQVDTNDTEVIFHALQTDDQDSVTSVLSVMSKVHGPWAFVYWQATSKKLWFGRDVFGRRSLLWLRTNNTFALSSTIDRPGLTTGTRRSTMEDLQNWEEVPACGIFCLDLTDDGTTINFFDVIRCFLWSHGNLTNLTHSNKDKTTACCPKIINSEPHLLISPIIVPFCNSIANQDNDLLIYDLIETILPNESQASSVIAKLLTIDKLRVLVDQFEVVLSESVKRRVENQTVTSRCMICTSNEGGVIDAKRCAHSKVAILFSGGLDSTVLCALADRFVAADEPIDLLNVAFELSNITIGNHCDNFEVPDRISGRDAVNELRRIAPKRRWHFVEVNITKGELTSESEAQIADVVFPLTTVLDSDIGCAVWFAARGNGRMIDGGKFVNYTSPSKVVLTGIGADEQLGGYARHRVCFKRGGWRALISELEMEMSRISQRNLGRDDRMISDHGREGRFPFLDEHVVNYLNSLPIWFKTNLNLPRGVGDKLLLRMLAFKLGLNKTALLEKRAIQFGSRIAKMEKSRNGSDICPRLIAKVT